MRGWEGERHVDEIMRCLQSTIAQAKIVRFRTLYVWVDLVG